MARRRRKSNGSDVLTPLIKLLAKVIGMAAASIITALASKSRGSKKAPARSRATRAGPSGDCRLEIVGEGSYQRALRSIAGTGEVRHQCIASVEPEDGNEYDNQAVVVRVDGMTVGYLSKALARRYRRDRGSVGTQCQAVIVGGGRDRSLGVWLALDV